MPILVMKDRKSKAIISGVVPEKGTHWYAIKKLGMNIDRLGYNKIEPAI